MRKKTIEIRPIKKRFGGNSVEFYDDSTYRVILQDGSGSLIDKEDWLRVSKHLWFVRKTTYPNGRIKKVVTTNICKGRKQTNLILARNIMGATDHSTVVDHINHDTLDNRKANLRIASVQQNNCNLNNGRRWKSDTVSGVSFDKKSGKYTVRISIAGKETYFGRFWNKAEAEALAIKLKNKYYGEFSPHWKPDTGMTK